MTTPLSDERLAEMRERCDKATPGPWDYDHMHFEIHAPHDDNYWVVVSEECNVPNDAPVDQFGHQYSPDYEFIAAARTDMPDLLDEVERLRDMLDRVAASDQAARASDRKRGELLVGALARVARLKSVLREVEWEPIYFTDEATTEDEPEICTRCHRRRTDGHAPDCALDAALREED